MEQNLNLENTEQNINPTAQPSESPNVNSETAETTTNVDLENLEVGKEEQEKIEADLEKEEKLIKETDGITDEELNTVEEKEITNKARDWSEAGFIDAKAIDDGARNRDFQRIQRLIRSGDLVELVQIAYEEKGEPPHTNNDLLAVFTYGTSGVKVKIPLQWFFRTVHTEPLKIGNNPSARPRDPYFANRLNLARFVGSKVKMVFKQIVPKDDSKAISADNMDMVFASRLEANQKQIDQYFFNPDIERPPQAGDLAPADIVAVSPALCHVNIFGVDTTMSRGEMDYQFIADQRQYFYPGERIHVKLTDVRINEETHTVRISASRRESPQVTDKTAESIEQGYIKEGMRISGIVTYIGPGPDQIIVGFHHQNANNDNRLYIPDPKQWYGDARVTYGFELKRPVLGDLVCVNITNISERTNPETGEKSYRIYGRLVSRSWLNLL